MKEFKINIQDKEIIIFQDEDGLFIKPEIVIELEKQGTATKPSHEPICMARKPLSEKTVAENVLKHGTGGINIDESRIPYNDPYKEATRNSRDSDCVFNHSSCGFDNTKNKGASPDVKGRFPANFIHDGSEEVVDLFPNTKSGNNCVRTKEGSFIEHGGLGKAGDVQITYGDEGSAARFFYCAKVSKNERNAGLEFLEVKQSAGGGGITSPKDEQGNIIVSGEKGCAGKYGSAKAPSQNHHPTVKPIALMRYLCKLVTPKGGTVLDPFTGSGSTGCGALLEGYGFIGIDLDPEYCLIAEARMKYWGDYPDPVSEGETLQLCFDF